MNCPSGLDGACRLRGGLRRLCVVSKNAGGGGAERVDEEY
jgi:hypothetical protein